MAQAAARREPAGQEPTGQEPGGIADLAIYAMPGHLIRRMHQVSAALFEGEVARLGVELTPVQYATLHALEVAPGIDQITLAQAIAYDPVTIGGVLQRLEGKGLIRREIAATDRRARCLYLEPAGAELLARVTPAVQAVQRAMLQGLAPDERETLCRLLAKTLAAVGGESRAPFKPLKRTPR